MYSSTVAAVPATAWPFGFAVSTARGARMAVFLMVALIVAVLLPVRTVNAAVQSGGSTDNPATATADVPPLKAVFIVGPAGSLTDSDLADAESLAEEAESFGMDVRRVFYPHATWDNVMANIQGANLVVIMGHGYGWPSPYPPFRESVQDGIGVDPWDGAGRNKTEYYGGNKIRRNWVLAPNAIVVLNHECYTAGNGEPGMAIPDWDIAVQRVDNYAAAFLAVGAGAVFAYSGQSFNHGLRQLFETNDTMEDIFTTTGSRPRGYYGYVGYDPRKFDSVRMPGNTNFLDPDPTLGFVRAVTGNLAMTTADWAQGGTAPTADPPVLSNFTATGGPDVGATGGSTLPVFTPNGDGNSDELDMTYTLDREAYVDLTVTNDSGTVVRTISSWSPGGDGSATWDGKNDAGNFVSDGKYTITATATDRSGNSGDPQSLQAKVLTAMSAPSASPDFFYPSDGDNLAATTTLSVTLDQKATFWWKIADGDGNVVATHVNNEVTDPGTLTWQWDGRDKNGQYVADGTYYSVTTAQTSAGIYYNSVPVVIDAFQASANKPSPFVRGTHAKFFVYSAEPMKRRVRLRLYLRGLDPKTYRMYKSSAGYYYVRVAFPSTAGTGTLTVRAIGRDINGQRQHTDFTYELQ